MSNNQNWNKMGEDIKDALSEALRSGDFTNLNDLVSQSVVNTLNEVGKHIPFVENGSGHGFNGSAQNTRDGQTNGQANPWQQAKERMAREQMKQQQNWQKHLQRRQAQIHQKEKQIRKREEQIKRRSQLVQKKELSSFPLSEFKRVGGVSNILYQVFGGIGLGVTLLVAFIMLLIWAAGIETNGGGWLVNFIFQLCFLYMIRLGIIQRKRLGRAERYLRLCGGNKFVTIENLAKSTGKKVHKVIKDIQKMLSLGMFPEGHLDEQKTCFMLNDEVYRQYQQAENGRILREARQQKALENSEGAASKDSSESSVSPTKAPSEEAADRARSPEISREQESELNTMVAEGMECIRKLRYLNDQIPGEVISAKLSRLENLLKDIFSSVREHPDQMHRMHKLMDYYLPTTLKLVEAYEEFDRVKAPGEDIIKAKTEIENTLDTINQAFAELLNNLFQDAVLDATTDAQVLKTMLAREGLTRQMDFTQKDDHD